MLNVWIENRYYPIDLGLDYFLLALVGRVKPQKKSHS
jgi:hypothetical protein